MAKYNQRVWESIKEKVIEVVKELIEEALAPSAQSEDGGETTEE